MVKIHKYYLPSEGIHAVEIPARKILSAVNQREQIVVYAMVDPEAPPAPFEFYMAQTGRQLPFWIEELYFLDTVSMDDGNYMVHVFYHRIDENAMETEKFFKDMEKSMMGKEQTRKLDWSAEHINIEPQLAEED